MYSKIKDWVKIDWRYTVQGRRKVGKSVWVDKGQVEIQSFFKEKALLLILLKSRIGVDWPLCTPIRRPCSQIFSPYLRLE